MLAIIGNSASDLRAELNAIDPEGDPGTEIPLGLAEAVAVIRSKFGINAFSVSADDKLTYVKDSLFGSQTITVPF